MGEPDFDTLRAERNAKFAETVAKLRAEGWSVDSLCARHDPNACYCACGCGGPCEHDWDGVPYESEADGMWSATCSKCGELAYNHSMRVLP